MTTRQITLHEHEHEHEEESSRRMRTAVGALERNQRLTPYAPARRTRKQAQDDFQRRVDEFLVMVSHELRTPITCVKANVQIAHKQAQGLVVRRELALTQADQGSAIPVDGELKAICEMQQALERSELAVNRLTRMVDDLLNAARSGLERLD